MNCEDIDAYEELGRFNDTQKALLVSRRLVYLTDLEIGSDRHGTIIAASYDDAEDIARRRGRSEKVIGRMGDGFLRSVRERLLRRW